MALFFATRINLAGLHRIKFSYGPRITHYQDVTVEGFASKASWSARFSDKIKTDAGLKYEREIDFEKKVPGYSAAPYLKIVLRPTHRLKIYTELNHSRFTPEGLPTELANNLFTKVNWQMSRTWGLRLIQQNTLQQDEEFTTRNSLLFTWIKSPGTEAYIGGTLSTSETTPADASVFAKLTWLFRL